MKKKNQEVGWCNKRYNKDKINLQKTSFPVSPLVYSNQINPLIIQVTLNDI